MTTQRAIVVALVLSLFALPTMFGQSAATLSGTVTDQSLAVLPGATVTAIDVATAHPYVVVTDEKGEYRISNLMPSIYKLQIRKSGFATIEVAQTELLVGQIASRDFKMTVASTGETISVTGEAPLIDTQGSEVGSNIDRRQLQEIPLQGRNWMTLAMFAKGITANDVSTAPGVGRDELFQLNIDGQQVTDKLGQARYGQPKYSDDAIAEYQIVTQNFDITQGRSTGIQVRAITKSGTNELHGSAYGFFRSDALNGEDPVAHRVIPYNDKQLGGTIGGPIKRDKLFFFGSYEHETELTTAISTPVVLAPETFAFPSENSLQEYIGRGDYQITDKDKLSVRASRSTFQNPFAATGGNVYPSVATVQAQNSTTVAATWTRLFTSNFIGEARFGYNGFEFGNDEPSYMQNQPQLSFPGVTIGAPSNQPNHFWQRQYQAHYDVLWNTGKHTFKFGGEFFRNNDYGYWLVVANGNYIFKSLPPNMVQRFPASAWNNPSAWDLTGLDPYVQEYDVNYRPSGWNVKMPQSTFGFWAGDEWKLSSRLSVNYGLRWDADFGVVNPPGIQDSSIPISNGLVSGDFGYKQGNTDTHDYSPRMGAAYQVGSKGDLVIRGGTGLFYSFPSDNVTYIKELYNNQTSLAIPNDGQPGFFADPLRGHTLQQLAAGGIKLPPQLKVVLDPNYNNPYSLQYSIGFQKQLGRNMSFDSDLVGWRWFHDQRDYDANLFFDPVTGYPKDPRKFGRPNATYGPVWLTASTGHRNYEALASSFTRRMTNKLQAGATYTLMFHMYDDNLGGSGALSGPANNQFNYLQGEWARSTDFQKHTLRAYALYQLPKGFAISPVVYASSGNYFQTSISTTAFGEGTNRLNVGAPITIPVAMESRFDGPGIIPTGGVVPRNALKGLPLFRLDMRLSKTFNIGERFRVEGIAEAFNLTNHANFGNYISNVNLATFGQPVQVSAFSGNGTAYVPLTGQLAFRVSF
jgi:hypothetical protein